jgi:lauroyl/myristoyl acyltransferase
MKRNPWYRLGTFRLALGLAKTLPRAMTHALARAIGHAGFLFAKNAVGSLRENLACVTGKKTRELDALCKSNCENFVKMLADYFYATTAKPDQILALLADSRGNEHIDAATARGKGVIVITAHLGNWELGGMTLALRGLPMTIVTMQEPTAELSRWRENYRRRLDIKTITVGTDTFSFLEMVHALRRNEFVAMLVDRPYEGTGSSVRFFGRDAFFSTAPALLWQHTGAAVLPAFTLQNEDGAYVSFAEPLIEMESCADTREALAQNTQRIATAFEAIIRKHPEQWFNYVPIWKAEN